MVSGSSVSFVDARSERERSRSGFQIAGAVRGQLGSLVQDAARLSRSRLVVVYGSGEQDLDVPRVAEALRGQGVGEVRILSGGFHAWSDLNYAVQPSST